MEEKRRHPRYRVSFPVKIDAPEKSDRIGVSYDVSACGMLLSTRSHFDMGQLLELTFRVGRDGDEQHVRGRVVRLTESWEHFFPRRIAIDFDIALNDLDQECARAISAAATS
jgi:hypothetical protein